MIDIEFSVSEFVGVFNQTIDFAYPSVVIQGELANFRITKNNWVYFDLKDEMSSVSFFGSKYKLSGPVQDGMLVKVKGQPRLHPNYGFKIVFESIIPFGKGAIKKQQDLLKEKLKNEGLFDDSRKRQLPYPPTNIGLITSLSSAAYADFTKILANRWPLVNIWAIDVNVQGDLAEEQIIKALDHLASQSVCETIVIIRGGGSPEDLAVFSSEKLTRAVALSRIPTLVAIGHEIDLSLAELVADKRASTPSNAAELLVPDRHSVVNDLNLKLDFCYKLLKDRIEDQKLKLSQLNNLIYNQVSSKIHKQMDKLQYSAELINALSPQKILKRGYAILTTEKGVTFGDDLTINSKISVQTWSHLISAQITNVKKIRSK